MPSEATIPRCRTWASASTRSTLFTGPLGTPAAHRSRTHSSVVRAPKRSASNGTSSARAATRSTLLG